MSKGSFTPDSLDRARDELFSHIRRCGVLDAETDQRDEWFDDTIQYIGERYPELGPPQLTELRKIGERYCAPAIPQGGLAAANEAAANEAAADAEGEAEVAEVSEAEVAEASEAEVAEVSEAAVGEVPVAEVEVAEVVETGEVSAA